MFNLSIFSLPEFLSLKNRLENFLISLINYFVTNHESSHNSVSDIHGKRDVIYKIWRKLVSLSRSKRFTWICSIFKSRDIFKKRFCARHCHRRHIRQNAPKCENIKNFFPFPIACEMNEIQSIQFENEITKSVFWTAQTDGDYIFNSRTFEQEKKLKLTKFTSQNISQPYQCYQHYRRVYQSSHHLPSFQPFQYSNSNDVFCLTTKIAEKITEIEVRLFFSHNLFYAHIRTNEKLFEKK